MPDSTAGRSLSGMRKGLSPIAWAGSNANPVSNRPANVEPVQAAIQASLPADKAEQLGAGNSWLVSPGTGVPGCQARQGKGSSSGPRTLSGFRRAKLQDLGAELAVDPRQAPEIGANAWFPRMQG